MRQCQYRNCSSSFEAKTHNQKYHSDECCRLETNARIMEKYYERKARRQGGRRECKSCQAVLSRYNDNQYCFQCENKAPVVDNADVLRQILKVS